MQPLITAELIVGGMCLAVGILHLVVYIRKTELKAELFFALLCFLASGSAFSEVAVYQAETIEGFISAFRQQVSLQGFQWIALAWFIFFYTGATRRWIAVAVSVVYAVAVFINIVSPYGVLFSVVDDLSRVTLAWGEQITFANGPTSNWRYMADAAGKCPAPGSGSGPRGAHRLCQSTFSRDYRIPGRRSAGRTHSAHRAGSGAGGPENAAWESPGR